MRTRNATILALLLASASSLCAAESARAENGGRTGDRPLGPAPASSTPGHAEPRPAGGWNTVAALAGVIGLAIAGACALRWMARTHGGLAASLGPGGRAPSGVVEVLARYAVSRGQRLVLLKIDRRVLIVAQQAGGRLGGGMSTLSEITDPEEVASIVARTREVDEASAVSRFRSVLSRVERAVQWDQPAGGVAADWPREFVEHRAAEAPRHADDASIGRVRERLHAMRLGDGPEAGP